MGGCGAPLRPAEVADPAAFDTQEEDPDGDYFARKQWEGARPGFCFKLGDKGVGYYKDVPYHISQAAAEKAALKLSAPTLANWFYELLQAPPSVKKADRFYELFQLDLLRVVGLSASHQTLTLTLTLSRSQTLTLTLTQPYLEPGGAWRIAHGGQPLPIRVTPALVQVLPHHARHQGEPLAATRDAAGLPRAAAAGAARPTARDLLDRLGPRGRLH